MGTPSAARLGRGSGPTSRATRRAKPTVATRTPTAAARGMPASAIGRGGGSSTRATPSRPATARVGPVCSRPRTQPWSVGPVAACARYAAAGRRTGTYAPTRPTARSSSPIGPSVSSATPSGPARSPAPSPAGPVARPSFSTIATCPATSSQRSITPPATSGTAFALGAAVASTAPVGRSPVGASTA